MSAMGRPQSTLNGMAHRHYQAAFVADGTSTEYALPPSILRGDDLIVFSGGLHKVVSASGIANDYAIRGITAGYLGDKNRVKFTVPPVKGTHILFLTAGG